eukprot:2049240-Prymnesium_polylepis.1
MRLLRGPCGAEGRLACPWRAAAAFSHVSVISLPRSVERRQSVRALLGQRLGLREGADFSFVAQPADCRAYGRWSAATSPLPSREDGASGAWWLHERTCKRQSNARHAHATQGGCLMAELEACREARGDAVTKCGGVCYTLSVASALREFLRFNRSTVLLVGACAATSAVIAASSSTQAAAAAPAAPAPAPAAAPAAAARQHQQHQQHQQHGRARAMRWWVVQHARDARDTCVVHHWLVLAWPILNPLLQK